MQNSAHLPFEEWLLAERPLSAYQEQALNEHLETCDACRSLKQSWGSVSNLFRTAPVVAPKVGFSARWAERQAAERLQKQRRQAWIIFGIVMTNALVFLGLLASQIVAMMTSPAQWLLVKMYFVTRYLALVGVVDAIFDAVSQTALAFPLIGLFFLVGLASFFSVLWVVAYRQLTSQTRRVK
jgi:predicted anti-sigma-YlaC factor YlaD